MFRPRYPVRRQRGAGSWEPPLRGVLPPGAALRSSAARPTRPAACACCAGRATKRSRSSRSSSRRTSCKVEFKTYIGGEQMLQFFAQSPKGTFDAIISDAEYVQKLTAQKALDPMNPADFPNLADYHPKYRDFPPLRAPDGKIWAVPTRFSFYGLSYNTKYMSEDDAKTWSSLFLPKYKGKVALFDWYLPNMSNASLAVKPEQPDALRHLRRPARQGEGVAVQAAAADRRVQRAEPGPGQCADQRGRLGDADRRHGDHADRRRLQELRLDRARRRQHPLERGGGGLRPTARTRTWR